MPTLQEQFGQIDIYLFDQLLKSRIRPDMTILDAGCGGGRNLIYLLREHYDILAVDISPEAINAIRKLAAELNPTLPPTNFRLEPVDRMSFPDACADVVISNTVLHFARDDEHFKAMLNEMWRTLKPGGLFFSRLGSTIGMENQVRQIEGRRYKSPDKSERYLVDEALLLAHTERLGAELADPIKTTIVQNLRAMTTWVIRKNPK